MKEEKMDIDRIKQLIQELGNATQGIPDYCKGESEEAHKNRIKWLKLLRAVGDLSRCDLNFIERK